MCGLSHWRQENVHWNPAGHLASTGPGQRRVIVLQHACIRGNSPSKGNSVWLENLSKVCPLAPEVGIIFPDWYCVSISISCKRTWCFPHCKCSIKVYLILQDKLRILSWQRSGEPQTLEFLTPYVRKVRGGGHISPPDLVVLTVRAQKEELCFLSCVTS